MEYLEFTQQPTAQILDTCAGLIMMQELRSATATFLADRWDDGTFLATADDIADLQEATSTFLAEHADSDCSCLGPVGVGLLLPDEQSLLPITDAVNRVRGAAVSANDLINIIDECVGAGWAYENPVDAPLPDASIKDVKPGEASSRVRQLVASSDFVENQFTLQEELYDAIDVLLGQRAGIDSSAQKHGDTDNNHTDSRTKKALRKNGQVFDASDVACRFKASNAAAFFDPVADTVVPYASFDQLLDIELTPPTVHLTNCTTLKVVTKLPTILEEEAQWSAASDASIDFADHRGFLKTIESRRENFLGDKHELVSCKTGVEDFDGFFGDDIWINAPDLSLALPVSQPLFPQLVDEADPELLGALITVLETMRAHSSTEMLTLIARSSKR